MDGNISSLAAALLGEYLAIVSETSSDSYHPPNTQYFIIDSLLSYPTTYDSDIESALAISQNDNELTKDDSINPILTQEKASEQNKNNSCSICLEQFGDQHIAELQCSHSFHSNCITEWTKYKQDCPICRSKIDFKRNDNEDIKFLCQLHGVSEQTIIQLKNELGSYDDVNIYLGNRIYV